MFLYGSAGFALMLAINAGKLWSYYISSVSYDEVQKARDFSEMMYFRFLEWESYIDPRLADFTAWIVVGGIAMAILLIAQNAIEDAETEYAIEKRTNTPAFRASERRDYFLRWLFRFSGVILMLVWLRVFFESTLGLASALFFYGAANLDRWSSIWNLSLSIFLSAVGIYGVAVCARLIMLRIRVFEVETN